MDVCKWGAQGTGLWVRGLRLCVCMRVTLRQAGPWVDWVRGLGKVEMLVLRHSFLDLS